MTATFTPPSMSTELEEYPEEYDEATPGGGFFEDYPDVDRHSCQLLGPTALVCIRSSACT